MAYDSWAHWLWAMGKHTSRPCTICGHERRYAIELSLVHRIGAGTIARRFNVSIDAVKRHARNHLTPVQRAALLVASKPTAVDLEELRKSEGQGLLASLVAQRARLQTGIELALEAGDANAATRAEHVILQNLTVVGKLLSQFVTHHEIRSTSLLVSPDYLALRSAILRALAPYPDARAAVGRALAELETTAADEIMANAARPVPKLIEAGPIHSPADLVPA